MYNKKKKKKKIQIFYKIILNTCIFKSNVSGEFFPYSMVKIYKKEKKNLLLLRFRKQHYDIKYFHKENCTNYLCDRITFNSKRENNFS